MVTHRFLDTDSSDATPPPLPQQRPWRDRERALWRRRATVDRRRLHRRPPSMSLRQSLWRRTVAVMCSWDCNTVARTTWKRTSRHRASDGDVDNNDWHAADARSSDVDTAVDCSSRRLSSSHRPFPTSSVSQIFNGCLYNASSYETSSNLPSRTKCYYPVCYFNPHFYTTKYMKVINHALNITKSTMC